MKQLIREDLYSRTIRDAGYTKEKQGGKMSFHDFKQQAREKPAFKKVLANHESEVIKLAEMIIDGKNYSDILTLTFNDYKNYVKNSGEDAYILAAVCEELAERRTGLREAKDEN